MSQENNDSIANVIKEIHFARCQLNVTASAIMGSEIITDDLFTTPAPEDYNEILRDVSMRLLHAVTELEGTV